MRVATHHAGSPVVVWKTSEHYIDVRISPAAHHHSIEIVRNGRVYHRELVHVRQAPKRICELMKEKLK